MSKVDLHLHSTASDGRLSPAELVQKSAEAGLTVIALTDKARGARGASAFLVEKDTPGFSFGKKERKMGVRASSTRELIFRNCPILEENIIGKPGMGFI